LLMLERENSRFSPDSAADLLLFPIGMRKNIKSEIETLSKRLTNQRKTAYQSEIRLISPDLDLKAGMSVIVTQGNRTFDYVVQHLQADASGRSVATLRLKSHN